ncbi:MAG: NADH-quinone oxidoreductase subunit NuoF [Chloroflexi bacterium]|nr:NADH-quinone oxidoreductase subunit NuoF [Chloroflexota bacterium]
MNIIYREKDIPNIHQMDTYLAHEGYDGLRRALSMDPKAVIDEVKASGLRGRGGAGFPTGVKWGFIPAHEPIKYVVVNADESETGTFKDRQIMENNPHQLIEGALICAWAIQATAVYIYLRGEFWDVAAQLDDCIADAQRHNLAGDNILNSGWNCPVYTHLGAGAYICGEESALLESLEGKLGQPRVRPPFPAQKGGGLYHEPTVVNNVETLANVPYIMRAGAEAFSQIGTEQSKGTKVFCVSGHVNKPGNYELPLGASMRELIYEHAGGIPDGKAIKGILPSGGSGPIMRVNGEEDPILDTPLSYEDMQAAGTILGSASVIVMDETVDMTWVASKVTKFFKHESCGKCTPCREGTFWLDKVIDRIMAGKGTPEDVKRIGDVAKNMQGTTLCALGDFAANPIIHTIKHFPEDFEQHMPAPEEKTPARGKDRPAPRRAQPTPAGD